MKLWQLFVFVVGLLLGALALAQPPADGGQGHPANHPPKEQPKAVTVQGEIKEIITAKGPLAMVHFRLATADAVVMVGVAPQKYLDKIGLKLQQGDKVTVNGIEHAPPAPAAQPAAQPTKPAPLTVIIAQSITTGEKTYQIRTEKNQPLWSEVEFLPQVTVDGTIKEIIFPEPQPKPAPGEQPKPAPQPKPAVQVPGIIVTTDKGDVHINGVPAAVAEQLGLKLEVGMKVTVAGWQTADGKKGEQGPVLARAITSGDKTITLRDDAGKPTWEKPKVKPANAGHGGHQPAGQ